MRNRAIQLVVESQPCGMLPSTKDQILPCSYRNFHHSGLLGSSCLGAGHPLVPCRRRPRSLVCSSWVGSASWHQRKRSCSIWWHPRSLYSCPHHNSGTETHGHYLYLYFLIDKDDKLAKRS